MEKVVWVIGTEDDLGSVPAGTWFPLSGFSGCDRLIDALDVYTGSLICRMLCDDPHVEGHHTVADRWMVVWSVDGGNVLRAFGRWAALQTGSLWEAEWAVQPIVDFLGSGESRLYEEARDASLRRKRRTAADVPVRFAQMAAETAVMSHSSWPKALPRSVHRSAGFAVQALATDRAMRETNILDDPDGHLSILTTYAGFQRPGIENWANSRERAYHDAYLRALNDLTERFNHQLESMALEAWQGRETWRWSSLEAMV